jgi:preprotein translocase subunit YajC
MYATVVEVDGDDVILEVAPGIEVRYLKRAVMDVVAPAETDEETDSAEETDETDETDDSYVDGQSQDDDADDDTVDDAPESADDAEETAYEQATGSKKD